MFHQTADLNTSQVNTSRSSINLIGIGPNRRNEMLATQRILNNKLPIFKKQRRKSTEDEQERIKKPKFSQIV